MSQEQRVDQSEAGVDIPYQRLSPEALHNMIQEFVTREWEEVGDASFTLEEKVEQVLQQLRDRKAKVVYDLASETGNIVVCR